MNKFDKDKFVQIDFLKRYSVKDTWDWHQIGARSCAQNQDWAKLPKPPPLCQTLHWLCRTVPLWFWQPVNRTSAAHLPILQRTQNGNLTRPHANGLEALWMSGGPAEHYFQRRDRTFPSNKQEERENQGKGFLIIILRIDEITAVGSVTPDKEHVSF